MAVNQRQNGVLADGPLDDTNLALLAELQADARLSLAELGRRVGLSAPAVADRLARLEGSGVIRGYRADVDPRALGRAQRDHPHAPGAARAPQGRAARGGDARGRRVPAMTGEDCYLIRAHVRDVQHLEEVIDRFALYGQTTSSILQSAPVPGRGIAL